MLKAIKHIQAKNYRTYEEVDIELSPGINIFRGGNDQGKSNIVWMLTDVLFNATGDDFITVGKKETEVTLDGVRWIKSKSKNEYSVPGHPEPFTKVGSESPQEVKDFTGFDFLKLGGKATDRCLNISHQLKAHFVINDSPSDNALLLGSLSKIEQIYRGVKTCNADLSRLKREQKEEEQRYDDLKKQYVGYKWVKSFGQDLSAIKERYSALQKRQEQIRELASAISELREAQTDRRQTVDRLAKLQGIDTGRLQALDTRIGIITALRQDVADLGANFKRVGAKKKRLSYILQEIESKRSELGKKLESGVCPITQEPLPEECKKKAINLF